MSIVLFLLVLPFIVVTGVALVEICAGLRPYRHRAVPARISAVDVVVLIPAHDEEAGIEATIATLRSRSRQGARILVIADNCTDDTAAVARRAGACAVERHDPSRRGKPYALAFGREQLRERAPEVVVVLDADAVPIGDCIGVLGDVAATTGRPVQSTNLIEPRSDASSIARFSAAAFVVKNLVRQLGIKRLGAPALLTGTGMAFPWAIFDELALVSDNVAEDLMLGVSCAMAGYPALYVPQVRVESPASSAKGTATQRRRWESGFFDTARSYTGLLLRTAVKRRRPGLAWMALHLATPPLLLLMTADAVGTTGLAAFAIAGIAPPLFWVMLALTVGLVAASVLSIVAHGRADLLTGWRDIPAYVMWKVKLSLAVLLRREREWIRTERD